MNYLLLLNNNLMGSSQSGAENNSCWKNISRCSHYESDYKIKKVKHVSVQFLPGFVEGAAVTGKWLTYIGSFGIAAACKGGIKNPTHDVVEIYYICNKCNDEGTITVELSSKGKEFSYGYYRKDYGNKRDPIFPYEKITVSKARDIYKDMNGNYDIVNYNCGHFASKYFNKLYYSY